MSALPIEPLLPEIARRLAGGPALVLQAPPGAGKTSLVPLKLVGEPWLAGNKIVMLEPRRLATRAAARRMASLLGEAVGETVGYRVRLDTKVGPRTRIEVVTDGVFTRMIQSDPALAGVGLVIFDEFHERSLDNDLGLALALETQTLRPDLKLMAMSATLDGAGIARLMGEAPIVSSEGRAFPVATRHLDRPASGRFIDAMAAAIRRAFDEESGDILAFLPGAGEIRRVQARLGDLAAKILPLYGDLPQSAQDAALTPGGGTRRVVLATAIAETSLTIEGVRIVVDGGLMRVPRFDPRTGMTRLETIPVSQASAEQRRGRAGRLEPGVCYRLWPEAAQRSLAPFTPPEILAADLAPLALELARWGEGDPTRLAWLDAPPPASYAQARGLLQRLGALDGTGRITPHGRELGTIGVHPRLAHMMLAAAARGFGDIAADLAALLGERDLLRGQPGAGDADLRLRLALLRGERDGGAGADPGALRRVREQARAYRRQLGIAKQAESPLDRAGPALAFAYPDRIAQLRVAGERQYLTSGGSGAYFRTPQPLAGEPYLAIADLDGDRTNAEIYSAASLSQATLEADFADSIEIIERIEWSKRDQAVVARRERRLGALLLKEERIDKPPPERLVAALLAGLRDLGLGVLAWSREAESFRARVGFLRRLEGEAWPDLSEAALLAALEDWLAPHLAGMQRFDALRALDPLPLLQARLDWAQRRKLDELAPTHWTVPSGSRIPIAYEAEAPVLAVRLQEMFGAAETPAIAGGRVALLLHLLSPAQRPMQVTRDLLGFWRGSYAQVRAELRGQYPKHFWPEDPLTAPPTARAKRRGT